MQPSGTRCTHISPPLLLTVASGTIEHQAKGVSVCHKHQALYTFLVALAKITIFKSLHDSGKILAYADFQSL